MFILEDNLKGLIGCRLIYNKYFGTFALEGNESILDFGCGGGAGSRCLIPLLNNEGHLTCIDISNHWIERAKKRLNKYPNVECIRGDIRGLNIPNNSFDVISIFHVIHDIAPQERQSTVNALRDTLKPEGVLFLRERVHESHGMPTAEIRRLFANAGFVEIYRQESKQEYIGRFQLGRMGR